MQSFTKLCDTQWDIQNDEESSVLLIQDCQSQVQYTVSYLLYLQSTADIITLCLLSETMQKVSSAFAYLVLQQKYKETVFATKIFKDKEQKISWITNVLTPNIKAGNGVNFSVLIVARKPGRWPCRAPTKYNLKVQHVHINMLFYIKHVALHTIWPVFTETIPAQLNCFSIKKNVLM